jgi:hypothetical protein
LLANQADAVGVEVAQSALIVEVWKVVALQVYLRGLVSDGENKLGGRWELTVVLVEASKKQTQLLLRMPSPLSLAKGATNAGRVGADRRRSRNGVEIVL